MKLALESSNQTLSLIMRVKGYYIKTDLELLRRPYSIAAGIIHIPHLMDQTSLEHIRCFPRHWAPLGYCYSEAGKYSCQ